MKVVLFSFLLLLETFQKIAFGLQVAEILGPSTINICDNETEINLEEEENSSSTILTLSPREQEDGFYKCFFNVTAPKNYVVNLQFIESSVHLYKRLFSNTSTKDYPCFMHVYLPDNITHPFWTGDLCSTEPLKQMNLLTPNFQIVWWPPPSHTKVSTKGRKIVITALGQGDACQGLAQHTCSWIGREPQYCIPDYLICDNYPNCPKGSFASDEDEKLCQHHKQAQNIWKQLAETYLELRGQFPEINPSSTTPRQSFGDWREWKNFNQRKHTTQKSATETKKPDSISSILSKYGPWGYLMLGMLICGTVLMFCGLWECCFRKPKTTEEEPAPQSQQPTTVLIIGERPNIAPPPRPPNYDDLDLPPSYTVLFPGAKRQTPPRGPDRSDETSACSSRTIDVHVTNSETIDAQAENVT